MEFHQTTTAPRINYVNAIDYLGHEALMRDMNDTRVANVLHISNPSVDKVTNLTKLAETANSHGLTYSMKQDGECIIATIIGEFEAVVGEQF